MKKIFYLLIIIVLGTGSCKKPEPEKVEIKSENLIIGTTTVLFEVRYKYPNVLKEIKIHFSFNDDMSNATVHETTVDEKQFNAIIEELTVNSTYYYLYEFFSGGTSAKSEVKSFTTKDCGLPTVSTNEVTNITETSAICGGNVLDAGGGIISARGVCWGTSINPTINTNDTTINGSGTGSFTSNITGLSPATTYYVRAYATNEKGTAYGEQLTFTTLIPTVTTNSVSNITSNTATCGGNVTNDGGSAVTARGVCWSTTINPTINNNKTVDGSGLGTFTSNITGLLPSTTYYVRAYATNLQGTAYGEQRTFKTKPMGGVMINGVYWAICNLDVGGVFCANTYDYGAYYQWGRLTDGHENPTSGTTTTLSTTDNPGHSNFILAGASPLDWRDPRNDFLWNSGTETSPIKTVNDPCPVGWRVPTQTELESLINTDYVWITLNGINGYFCKDKTTNKSLFLPAAGVRDCYDGSLMNIGWDGGYWSNTPYNIGAILLSFNEFSTNFYSYRSFGFSVRCVAE